MQDALEGVRIVEWGSQIAGIACGYMMGDLGAEVIKIEEPKVGDPSRERHGWPGSLASEKGGYGRFELWSRNKKSITLDLKKEKGREILYQLIKHADVFTTNHLKSRLVRTKADYETLRAHNPRLIYAYCSAYGEKGPWAGQRGFDPGGQALSGIMWAAGDRDDPEPVMVGEAMMDQMAATMLAYGILAALYYRERTGKGQELQTSILGSVTHMEMPPLGSSLLSGRPHVRHTQKRCRRPLYNFYRCADGKWLLVGEAHVDRYWSEFCRAMGLEHVEDDARFKDRFAMSQHYIDLIAILNEAFATRTREEWLQRFRELGVGFGYASVLNYQEIADEPQHWENEYLVEFDHPVLGPIKYVGFPVSFSETPARVRSGAPDLGQHTEEVLTQILGYSGDEIARLRQEEVV